MELGEYIKALKKYKYYLLFWVILISVIFFLYANYSPTKYSVSVDFMVSVVNKQGNEQYQYDGYYAMMSSDFVAKTLVSWFKTPSVVLGIFDKASIERPEVKSLNQLSRIFKTTQFSAQNIVVKFTSKTNENANKLSKALKEIVETRATELNKDEKGETVFNVKGSEAVIIEQKQDPLLFIVIGFVFSLMCGLLIIPLLGVCRVRHLDRNERSE